MREESADITVERKFDIMKIVAMNLIHSGRAIKVHLSEPGDVEALVEVCGIQTLHRCRY